MKKTANRVFISALTAATIFTTACIPVLAAEEAPIILENGKDRSKEENIQAEIRMENAAKITDEIASGADFPNVMFLPYFCLSRSPEKSELPMLPAQEYKQS